jgi:hypothetical protein
MHRGYSLTKFQFKRSPLVPNQSGQAFFEYIFLLGIVMILSFVVLRGFNGGLGDLWLFLANKICYPAEVTFR